MGVLYRTTKKLWRLLGLSSYEHLFHGRSRLSRVILAAKRKLETTAAHDELYDEKYFRLQEREMAASAVAMAEALHKIFAPAKVIDVGCGSGAVIQQVRELGVHAVGLEHAEVALGTCRSKGLEVYEFDIERDAFPELHAPLVLSTEVAEHLPEQAAARYVSLLCALSERFIVMTAATPGQGGIDHVNEQPHDYWIAMFQNQQAVFREDITAQLRADWQARKVNKNRARNVLVFEMPASSGREASPEA